MGCGTSSLKGDLQNDSLSSSQPVMRQTSTRQDSSSSHNKQHEPSSTNDKAPETTIVKTLRKPTLYEKQLQQNKLKSMHPSFEGSGMPPNNDTNAHDPYQREDTHNTQNDGTQQAANEKYVDMDAVNSIIKKRRGGNRYVGMNYAIGIGAPGAGMGGF